MRENQINRIVLRQMKEVFYKDKTKPYIDWMGYPITDFNKPSYHHISKASDLKKNNHSSVATFDNGAYLGKTSHEILHRIEQVDKDLYDEWNYLFTVINRMRVYPIDDVLRMINCLKDATEELMYEKNKRIM